MAGTPAFGYLALASAVAAAVILATPVSAGAETRSRSIDTGHGIFLTEAESLTASRDDSRPGATSPDAPTHHRASPGPRIVGGTQVSIQNFPWQVALTFNPAIDLRPTSDRQICGGTLLAPRFVLTAAHCVYNSKAGAFRDPRAFAVVSGRTFLNSNEGREDAISAYYVPTDEAGRPLYREVSDGSARWDVAIVELPVEAIGTPIKLAGPDESHLWAPESEGSISGWGSTSKNHEDFPEGLQATTTTLFRDFTCSRSFPPPGGFESVDMLCTSGLDHSVCVGDSGGPLVVPTADGSHRLVGVTSWGVRSCGDSASVFARVASDPLRSSLRNAMQSLAGVDVAGSGAQPASFRRSFLAEAKQNSLVYAERQCAKDRYCRSYHEGSCKPSGGGYRCKALNFQKDRRFKFLCSREIVWLPVATGRVNGRPRGGWECRRGW